MIFLITLSILAAASSSSLRRSETSYGYPQYATPSVYSYRQPYSYDPPSPGYIPSQQQASQLAPIQKFVSSPQYIESPSEFIQSTPQFDTSLQYISPADCLPNSPQYDSSQEFLPISQQYIPASSSFLSSSPQIIPNSPNFVSSSPEYAPSISEFVPSSPQYVLNSPKLGSTSLSFASLPQYYSGAASPITTQWSTATSSATGSSATATASSYSVQAPYAYNTNSYRMSQPTPKIYSAPTSVGRWDPITNTWC